MPKSPILSRECFFETLKDGTFRDLDWNLVNTELGAMIEPNSFGGLIAASGVVTQVDIVDCSFNKLTNLPEDVFYARYGGGRQVPIDFNYNDGSIR